VRYVFHPEAEEELNNVIDYYESCRVGLGREFVDEVYRTIQRILLYPDAWQPFDHETRRCLTNRFPFGIVYDRKEGTIVVLAVMHLHRKPGYWLDRTSGKR
jgi:plasmid stabilization system protein ParE